MDIKDRLKALRVLNGLSAAQLAVEFGKSESAVRMWETGRSKPDADTLIKLAQFFECTTDYLLGLSDVKNEKDFQNTVERVTGFHRMYNELDKERQHLFHETTQKLLLSLIDSQKVGEPLEGSVVKYCHFIYLLSTFYNIAYYRFPDQLHEELTSSHGGDQAKAIYLHRTTNLVEELRSELDEIIKDVRFKGYAYVVTRGDDVEE